MIQNKQIIYPTFITRIFTMILDSICLAFVSSVMTNILIQTMLWVNKVDNVKALVEIVGDVGFMQLRFVTMIIHLILFCLYILGFWFRFSATPAQIILRLKILNKDTMQKPSKSQLIIRFFGLLLFPISIIFTLFTKRKQALHDLISKTVIISK